MRRFVYTSVDVDGTLGGPALDALAEAVEAEPSAEFLYSGGIGALAPERRQDLARLGFRAVAAGTLANYLSASIAGILL